MSLVRWLPPSDRTAVCLMAPSTKMAMSVVPPPMSIRATPSSFSSAERTASEEASCSRTMSATSTPARLQLLMMFWALATAPVTICTLASRRTPLMPSGSLMPSWSSMMNSWGRMWITSRSMGMAIALAASMTRRMSSLLTSRFLIAITPWELNPLMWPPAIPAKTDLISQPAISSASCSALRIASTVLSMLITTPLRSPLDGLVPMPTISSPSSVMLPTMAQILVVPMSRPTIRFSLLCCS